MKDENENENEKYILSKQGMRLSLFISVISIDY